MIDTNVAVATTNFQFGMCNCTVDSDVSTGGFPLVLEILHVPGHAHVRSHVSPSMECKSLSQDYVHHALI